MRHFLLKIIVLPWLLLFAACGEMAREGESRELKDDCLSAADERCYAEMTEYTVLKDSVMLQRLRSSGKVRPLAAGRKVKVLKRKVDIALVEYSTRHGRRQAWVAVKNLR